MTLPYVILGVRYHGNNEIKEGGRFKTSLEVDQKLYYLARLQISGVAKADSGEYRACAKNKHGQGTATINLNFEGGDKPKYEKKKPKRADSIMSMLIKVFRSTVQ